jgi:hypothetical protein
MTFPTHLYKYQRLTAHTLASLLNDTVWLSSPTSFNDPFDCAIPLSNKKIKESIEHALTNLAARTNIPIEQIPNYDKVFSSDKDAYETLRNSLKETMKKIGVLCLSSVPDEILMWSHYADHHRGFCVAYDFAENSYLRKIAHPVRYSETLPVLSLTNLDKDAETNFIDTCVFTKAKKWEYEQEWRVLMHEGGRCFQSPSTLTSIIFGARMSLEDKVMLYQALRKKKELVFKEAELLEDRFGIQFKEFSLP